VLLRFQVALRTLANAVPLLAIPIHYWQLPIEQQTGGYLYPIAPVQKD
jgi:hypothetical protein